MLERNKVMRVLTEERVLREVDHPFLASLQVSRAPVLVGVMRDKQVAVGGGSLRPLRVTF